VPARARALLDGLRDRMTEAAYQHARLLASEAAANAVVHGAEGADVRLRALIDGDTLRVEIQNTSAGKRPRVSARDVGEGGLGLQILDILAAEWGTEHNDHTLVWFEVPVDLQGGLGAQRGAG
jgi:anti-sigma regulatory factor (Ser/Thr protein kinase)